MIYGTHHFITHYLSHNQLSIHLVAHQTITLIESLSNATLSVLFVHTIKAMINSVGENNDMIKFSRI
jgi:hypothetical protein